MLDWGIDLALPLEKKAIQGKEVFFVDGDALAAQAHFLRFAVGEPLERAGVDPMM